MSGFKALNIESDDESDIEVDNTKEIQIEEALKLYQAALKHHADGPGSYAHAADAYRALFDSEIFQYPESQTELKRIELYGPSLAHELPLDGPIPGRATAGDSFDTGPSTLPHILHLSHKNYAQFKLDALAASFDDWNVTLNHIVAEARSALTHFVSSLDKDDTDLELWRRTASVGEILDSKRIARYCLESVLDGDDEGLASILALPGLAESFAAEQLRELVAQLQDQLSALQTPLSISNRRALSSILKQKLHPYIAIVHRSSALRQRDRQAIQPLERAPRVLPAPKTWAELGDTILRQQMAEQHGTAAMEPGLAVSFDLAAAVPPLPSPQVIERPRSPKVLIPRYRTRKQTVYPDTLALQFPGLDNGQPTVQPRIAAADPSMEVSPLSPVVTDTTDSLTTTLPSRKRSGDAAGIHDTEEGRTKSKRIRARDSTVDAAGDRQADANLRWEHEQALNEFQAADDWMFETVSSLFERLGIAGFDAARHVRQELQATSSDDDNSPGEPQQAIAALRHVRSDLQGLLCKWQEQQAQLLLHGGENLDISQNQSVLSTDNLFGSGGAPKTLTKVDPLPDDGLQDLLKTVNAKWSLTADVAWEFVQALLRPGKFSPRENSYTRYQWPEVMKTIVVRVLVNFDEILTEQATAELERWQRSIQNISPESSCRKSLDDLPELLLSIFELHLDVYSLIKQANSGVEQDTIVAQGDRLQRWSDLAREAMVSRREAVPAELHDHLTLRFMWATTFAIGASPDVTQEHAIECMHDLRRILIEADEPVIWLQNNAIMPEVSLDALNRELSKLKTKDFFLKVTSQDVSDPAAVIENLEPLLEALDMSKLANTVSADKIDRLTSTANVPIELTRFLEASSVSVRLMLWQRLRDAYVKIEYKPMVVCCYLRMIGMVLEEMKSAEAVNLDPAERLVTELKSLRLIFEWVKRLFDIIESTKDGLQCMDDDYVNFAARTFGELLQIIQVFNVAEDSLSVGKSDPPFAQNGMPLQSFQSVMKLKNETQVRVWILLYAILQEAMSQNRELFPTPTEDRFDFLRVVHRNLGIRGICSCMNRKFVRMLKDEFLSMTHVEGYDSEQAQVWYDLYGLNCFLNPSHDLIEHHCTRDAFLDRGVALQAVDLLLAQANKLAMKELVKHSLKDTIEEVHGALARKRPSEAILRNREVIQKFLKSHIQPLDLYSCLKGGGNQLSMNPVPEGDAVLASKGWFFLMGHMSLTKFRSQKRNGPMPAEDVDIAIAFFMQDLEFTMDHWETWFRLGQAYDTKIEESVLWSAEKLNNSMQEIVTLQKSAIHCFTMATALACRSADLHFETSSKITELYSNFAMRLYASSREPFSMKPFEAEDGNIFVSDNSGVHKSTSLRPVRVYTVWKLASVLFKRALTDRAEQWQLHYMIGKCLWKMHNASDHIRGHDQPPTGDQVSEAFVRALELLPDKDKRESKDSKREPILEPQYKLLTIVNKLWRKRSISPATMKEALEHSHYARKEGFPESMAEWKMYVLAVLKSLRSADKSNWYHRIIARHAQIVYAEDTPSTQPSQEQLDGSALAAKEVLTAQMFTKTMALQVWKPDNERPGRHFVYTTRYTRFIITIFKQLKDRANLETLARRVRRRQHDLFEQSLVWQDICAAWLKLLREHGNLSEGLETSCFSNIAYEDFLARKEPLEKWMQETPNGTSPALDVLREVQEMKKINQGLMKPGAIDDLIGDSYAQLFNTVGKQLWELEERQRREGEASRAPEAMPAVASPMRNPTMSLSHLMNVDGAAGLTPAPAEPDIAPVRRKVGVGRREIRTNAEACAYKGGAAANKEKAAINDGTTSTDASAVHSLEDQDQRSSFHGGLPIEHSAPGSIHDDADDESELSELEEERDDGEDKAEDGVLQASSPLPEAQENATAADDEDEDDGADDVDMEDEAN